MTNTDSGIYRMIDANVDRSAEALRVVGDVARFVLDDPALAHSWRDIRGDMWKIIGAIPGLQKRGLEYRDSVGDVGREFKAQPHSSLVDMTRSNIHRAQESFRVLEETFRTVDASAVTKFSQLRYRCYDLEPPTFAGLEKWSHTRKLDFNLYVVLGREFSKGRDFDEVARKAMDGGAGCIQLRDKDMSKREMLVWAYRLRELTAERGVTFIMNDHLDIALAVEADGVHLGQDDFPIAEARRIAGPNFIIGSSTHSVDEAKIAVEEGASYINIGPIFATQTKKNVSAPVGPDLITEITSQVDCPFTVMGGIKIDNVDQPLQKGARRIAVVTAVVGQDDITAAAQAFTDKIKSYL